MKPFFLVLICLLLPACHQRDRDVVQIPAQHGFDKTVWLDVELKHVTDERGDYLAMSLTNISDRPISLYMGLDINGKPSLDHESFMLVLRDAKLGKPGFRKTRQDLGQESYWGDFNDLFQHLPPGATYTLPVEFGFEFELLPEGQRSGDGVVVAYVEYVGGIMMYPTNRSDRKLIDQDVSSNWLYIRCDDDYGFRKGEAERTGERKHEHWKDR